MRIHLKSPQEIEKMRIAGKLAAELLDYIEPFVQCGVTTNELNELCHHYQLNIQNTIPAPLHYGNPPFPKSICTSVNHVICHGIPNDIPLKEGDIINIDVTVIKDGFHGDTSRMFSVGKINHYAKRLIQIAHECMMLGINQVKPGNKLGNVGYVIQQHAESNGYSVVREFCGHGIGKNFHEAPQVLHYGQLNTGLTLEPGMIFTVEPMINQGKRHLKILSDHWTVVTKDRSLSAQWEHEVLVTDTGYEILTVSPKYGMP
ncbi:MAG: type I methionyl aminopeptidase [Neisseriaceae bacterium]